MELPVGIAGYLAKHAMQLHLFHPCWSLFAAVEEVVCGLFRQRVMSCDMSCHIAKRLVGCGEAQGIPNPKVGT